MARIVCIGEAMIELSRCEGGGWTMGYGGDTVNTAVHLARAGHNVAYMTAMGTDPFSDDLVHKEWPGEGLDTSLVLRDPARGPGLYAITTDPQGERSFTYWRSDSAARGMFDLDSAQTAMYEAEWAELFYFSLISLAILPRKGRQQLLDLAVCVQANGGKVAFDGNYRPRLWTDAAEAIAARDAAIAIADIGLPTLEDEALLSGQADADQVARHWTGLGCAETIVKLGSAGCRLPDGTVLSPPAVLHPVDTSGAGDAFNGGYLAARCGDAPVTDAAKAGHRLAGWVVMRPGAIPHRDQDAPYPNA